MERKEITTKKETNIRKTQESKTEVSDSGFIRRTKSKILTEYVTIETELVMDNNAGRSPTEGESFPELLRKEIMDKETSSRPLISGEDFSRTSDNCNVSEENASSITIDESVDAASDVSGEFLDSLKNGEKDLFKCNGKRESAEHIINHDKIIPSIFCSNLNGFCNDTSARNTPFRQNEKESENKESDSENKESDSETEERNYKLASGERNARKNIKTVNIKNINITVQNTPCFDSDLNEVKMSKIGAIIDNIATHLSQNNAEIMKSMVDSEDNVIFVNGEKKVEKTDTFKSNDMYDKGDSSLISAGGGEQIRENRTVIDRESLERSVRYLVNYFENIKNCGPSKANFKPPKDHAKTEEILDSDGCQQEEIADAVNIKDKCLTSGWLKSCQVAEDSKKTNGITNKSHPKEKIIVCQAPNKEEKICINCTKDQTPDDNRTEAVISNSNNNTGDFCVVKRKRPQITTESLKSTFGLQGQHRFIFPDNTKNGSNNDANASEPSFISPRFACKKLRPNFCRPVFHHGELQMCKEKEDVHTGAVANSSDVSTNENPPRPIDINRQAPLVADKSFVFLTPKCDGARGKVDTCSKTGGLRTGRTRRSASVTKDQEENSWLCDTDYFFSEKIFFFVAVVFTIIGFYKYSLSA